MLSREAIVPCLRPDPGSRLVRGRAAWRCASRRQTDHLDDTAAGRTAPARDAPKLALVTASRLASAQSREDAVDIRHWPSGSVRVAARHSAVALLAAALRDLAHAALLEVPAELRASTGILRVGLAGSSVVTALRRAAGRRERG